MISDLWAAYQTGGALINRALDNARQELGRQERNITPVDLAANEIYDILRKRLFSALPDRAEIEDIAAAYGKKLEEATKSKVANRGAEAIADEVAATYPFHPRLKNVIALFKENEQFKQTRGLIELVSRLLRSVWKRTANDVFLIGPQHFDLSIPEVRDKLAEISGMRDVIAKDLWDSNHSAHAQIIDLNTGKEAATQVGSLLFAASLSTAVNAVKGLTREEMVECLVSPLREPSDFLAAFEEFEKSAWYLHHTQDGRFYFDRQENLTKLLQSIARDAPDNLVDDLIRNRLKDMFKASRKTAYEEVLPLPRLEDAADRVRKARVLLIVSPDSKIPPEEVQKFFEGLSQKNNLCVLTGDKTAMGSVEKAARQLFAVQKADGRIPKGHPQRDDLEKKQQTYEQDFNATVLSLFDKVLFPIQRVGRSPQLAQKALDMTRDVSKPFNGEEQVERTLTSNPLKPYLDVEKDSDPRNPSRLEQRLGRIKRFGQARRTVDMLNLVYHDTQDEKIYQALSRRLKDKFDIFGGLPDTIEDEWIENVERLESMMDEYIHLRRKARDVFELRYKETIDPDENRWELCSRVLARKDIVEKLSEPW